jgi:hypothetical protein
MQSKGQTVQMHFVVDRCMALDIVKKNVSVNDVGNLIALGIRDVCKLCESINWLACEPPGPLIGWHVSRLS